MAIALHFRLPILHVQIDRAQEVVVSEHVLQRALALFVLERTNQSKNVARPNLFGLRSAHFEVQSVERRAERLEAGDQIPEAEEAREIAVLLEDLPPTDESRDFHVPLGHLRARRKSFVVDEQLADGLQLLVDQRPQFLQPGESIGCLNFPLTAAT